MAGVGCHRYFETRRKLSETELAGSRAGSRAGIRRLPPVGPLAARRRSPPRDPEHRDRRAAPPTDRSPPGCTGRRPLATWMHRTPAGPELRIRQAPVISIRAATHGPAGPPGCALDTRSVRRLCTRHPIGPPAVQSTPDRSAGCALDTRPVATVEVRYGPLARSNPDPARCSSPCSRCSSSPSRVPPRSRCCPAGRTRRAGTPLDLLAGEPRIDVSDLGAHWYDTSEA